MPFTPARNVLRELTGIDVFGHDRGRTGRPLLDWGQEDLPPFSIQPDGSMVPMRPEDWPEFWGADVVNVSEKRREVLKKPYVAIIGGVDEFQDKLWAATVGMTGPKRFLPAVLGAGADWITHLTDDLFPDAIRIVDIFHVLEKIHEIVRLRHGPDSVPGKAWAKRLEALLKESRIDEVLAALAEAAEATPYWEGEAGPAREGSADGRAYLEAAGVHGLRHLPREGPDDRQRIVENCRKCLIAGRLKQVGMHGSLEGANAIAHLRALRLSDGPGWERLWKRMTPAQDSGPVEERPLPGEGAAGKGVDGL